MVAINSAIEVDLTGQVCADSIGHRLYSGVGGQMDFIRGAALGRGGAGDHRAAVDRRRRDAVAHRRRRSRPAPAWSPRARHVQTVVTEYGVAELHGRSIAERAAR